MQVVWQYKIKSICYLTNNCSWLLTRHDTTVAPKMFIELFKEIINIYYNCM